MRELEIIFNSISWCYPLGSCFPEVREPSHDCCLSPMKKDPDLKEAGDHGCFLSALPEPIDSCFIREAWNSNKACELENNLFTIANSCAFEAVGFQMLFSLEGWFELRSQSMSCGERFFRSIFFSHYLILSFLFFNCKLEWLREWSRRINQGWGHARADWHVGWMNASVSISSDQWLSKYTL